MAFLDNSEKIINKLSHPVYILDGERYIEANTKGLEYFGLKTVEELLGKQPYDSSLSPRKQPNGSSSEDLAKSYIEAAYSGMPQNFEWIHKASDQTNNLVEVHLSPISIEGKDYLLVEFRSIKNEKMNSEKFEAIFESAPDPIYLMTFTGTFLDRNSASESLTGYQKTELIGKNIKDISLVSTKDIPKAIKNLAINAMGKPSGPDTYTIKTKDSKVKYAEIRTVPVELDRRKVALGTARDITLRIEAQEKAEIAKEEIRQYLDLSSAIIVALDIEGNVTMINRPGAELLGYNEDEIIGKN